VQFPYDQAKQGMMSMMGVSESVANAYNEFIEGMNTGRVFSDVKRTPASTTPTSIEEFAQVFKTAYDNG
jgi:hypothetical protein